MGLMLDGALQDEIKAQKAELLQAREQFLTERAAFEGERSRSIQKAEKAERLQGLGPSSSAAAPVAPAAAPAPAPARNPAKRGKSKGKGKGQGKDEKVKKPRPKGRKRGPGRDLAVSLSSAALDWALLVLRVSAFGFLISSFQGRVPLKSRSL